MIEIITGDCRTVLDSLPANSHDVCVTSPPYYKQRDYQHDGQIGLEGTIEDYVKDLVQIMGQVAGVLKPTGTLWLNLADKYIKKRLQGIPWRVALALQDHGWYLRSAVVWRKPNQKPDGARDRPTNEYEFVFMLTLSDKYYYDADAIREAPADYWRQGGMAPYLADGMNTDGLGSNSLHQMAENGRNKRNVWDISTVPGSAENHFAAFPPELPRTCIKASCPPDGSVLDPFAGTCTTGLVAHQLGLDGTMIEINPVYANDGKYRIDADAPLLRHLSTFLESL